jgi:filamentous hemagglutinin family protein
MAQRDGRVLLGLALSMALLGPDLGRAEVATDGTLGARVRLTGKKVTVPSRLGQIRGKNLFHSFERFGINTGSRVTFTAPDRLKLKNVISRVTGGEPSKIDGTLASKVRGADLWLLNPAGILFGPNARLDVPGSFHASTADELRFKDGTVFSALDPQGSVLSVAAPEAFGFLGAKPAGITVDHGTLGVPLGKTLSLVGGDIDVVGGRLQAAAGTVGLAAEGTAGEVGIGGDAAVPGGAEIRLTDGAAVETSGDGGGMVRIRGGQIIVTDRSHVTADNRGAADAREGVAVIAHALAASEGSTIGTDARSAGVGGRVLIQADELEISDGGIIGSASHMVGDAGNIDVTAGRIIIDGGGRSIFTALESKASSFSTGNAGKITVAADNLEIRQGGVIASSTFGSGDAGEVALTIRHLFIDRDKAPFFTGIASNSDFTMIDDHPLTATGGAGRVTVKADTLDIHGGEIASNTFGLGDAGEVAVTAGRLTITGNPSIPYFTGLSSGAAPGSSGAGGRVTVRADTLELRDTGQISSGTSGLGNAGEVAITAGHLTVVGEPSAAHPTAISSNAEPGSTGAAGRVAIQADTFELRDNGQISSGTFGSGDAGEVDVTAGTLIITNAPGSRFPAGLSTTAAPGSTGAAGRVTIQADTLEIHDTGQISSGTFGPGDAGEVDVTTGRLSITGNPSSPRSAGLFSSAQPGSTGAAGRVTVRADTLELRDTGAISSATFGPGNAGEVAVTAGHLTAVGEPAVRRPTGLVSTAEAGSTGAAGRVTVTAENLELRGGGLISSATLGSGDAGEVDVTAGRLTAVGDL